MTARDAPRATARLQLHAGFTLDDARATVPYHDALGISHLYLSPILPAREGSTHGYDVIAHDRVADVLGGEPALRRLVDALRARGMGAIVDIVPNHMAASTQSVWWRDLLEHGRRSAAAAHFDIDWEPPDPALRDRVLVPQLPRPLDAMIDDGDVAVVLDREAMRLAFDFGGLRLPLAPESCTDALADWPRWRGMARECDTEDAATALPARLHDDADIGDLSRALRAFGEGAHGRRRLRALIERQHYLPCDWRDAGARINWRRFFEIGDLVALRVENEDTFAATHDYLLSLYARGLVDGFRVDHVDGLRDPHGYCARLRAAMRRLIDDRPRDAPRSDWLLVEKILADREHLRDWDVDGTTGYDFMDRAGAVLHDAGGEPPLSALWRAWAPAPLADYEQARVQARRQTLARAFAADLRRAARAAGAFDASIPVTRAEAALAALAVHLPVYRTYLVGGADIAADAGVLSRTVDAATAHGDGTAAEEGRSLLLAAARAACDGDVAASEALARFEQLVPGLAAKAEEDTLFYRYGRLLSRNEVGSDPARLALPPDEFHREMIARAARPLSLLATATHDHKRGEDVRARLAVLSERATWWRETVERWRDVHAPLRTRVDGAPAPDDTDLLVLYQTLVGAWPADLGADDDAGVRAFADRVAAWQRKALREAKRHTAWTQENARYERAADALLHALLADDTHRRAMRDAVDGIAAPGAIVAASQCLLRLTCPGVPDLYQGTDCADFSLVDPDNRRPVDYVRREATLHAQDVTWHEHGRDGVARQHLIARVLRERRRQPRPFARGDYLPLHADGAASLNVLAFARRAGEDIAVVVTTRLPAQMLDSADDVVVPASRWAGAALALPGIAGAWRDVVSGATHDARDRIAVAALLREWPVALLVPAS